MNKVVFLDRDGVINRDSPLYIKSWQEFAWLPGSLEAMVRLCRGGFDLMLITNQSIINRGMVPIGVLDDIHRRLARQVVDAGGRIADIFFCPHRPDEDCDCRKPKPGLIQQACRCHGIDVRSTVMVGDSAKDIECAHHAGCGASVLVRSGKDATVVERLQSGPIRPTVVVDDLAAAADWILSRRTASDRLS